MLYIKNVTYWQRELSIFLSSYYTLYRIKSLGKKLCFGLLKNKRFFKSKRKKILEWFFFCCLDNISYQYVAFFMLFDVKRAWIHIIWDFIFIFLKKLKGSGSG